MPLDALTSISSRSGRIIGAISSARRDPRMRVLLWHGWLLEGTGSNVYTARVAEELAADGHDVVLLCQEGRPERYPWVDATGTVGGEGVSDLTPNGTMAHPGRCILLRPDIGQLLSVFVLDEYEGSDEGAAAGALPPPRASLRTRRGRGRAQGARRPAATVLLRTGSGRT